MSTNDAPLNRAIVTTNDEYSRPVKRLCRALSQTGLRSRLPQINTSISQHTHDGDSVSSQTRSAPLKSSAHNSTSSTKGRKKYKNEPPSGNTSEAHSAQFIQAAFQFPEHQTWLKSRPRQRRGVTNIPENAATTINPTPVRGEILFLDRDSDQIAALISQKLQTNDSKLFRERMALQQRLYRGEEDEKSKIMTANHVKLRRRMELSSQGVFEGVQSQEKPEESSWNNSQAQQLAFTNDTYEQESDGRADAASHVATGTQVDGGDMTHENDFTASDNWDSDKPHSSEAGIVSINHELQSDTQGVQQVQPIAVTEPFNSAQITLDSNFNPYDSNVASFQSLPTQNGLTVCEMQAWYQQSGRPAQSWTTQTWNTIPSVSTPHIMPNSVLQSLHTPQAHVLCSPIRDFHDRIEYHNSTDETDGSKGWDPGSHVTQPDEATDENNESTTQLSIPRAGKNMFTGQAREDVLNSNTSHHVDSEKRRNMFSGRLVED